MDLSRQSPERDKSLEELEGVQLGPPAVNTHLVRAIHRLYKKPIGEFAVEDLRIVIGQGRGLEFLVPLALDVLERDALAEGDFYEGDLLKAVLSLDSSYWHGHRPQLQRLAVVAKSAVAQLGALDTTEEIRQDLRVAIERVLQIRAAAV